MKLRGHIKICNKKKVIYEKDNLILDDGLYQVIELLVGTSAIPIDGIEIGDSNTPALSTDTTLSSPIVGAIAGTSKAQTNNILNCKSLFLAGDGTGTWAELGLWTGTWAGPVFTKYKLLSRVILEPVIVKSAGTDLNITWTITVERKIST